MCNRQDVYYWKCDRPFAFYAIENEDSQSKGIHMQDAIAQMLTDYFYSDDFTFCPAGGQGNHLTYLAVHKDEIYFVRIENGPDDDEYMEIEAQVIRNVASIGICTPKIYAVDSKRKKYPFAYQIMENLPYKDLNKIYKEGNLDLLPVMEKIGVAIATWQQITPENFGPFNIRTLRNENKLSGLHPTYKDYFLLNWGKHLDYLTRNHFLTAEWADELRNVVHQNEAYLELNQGCLVHKDLALWNILGNERHIEAFIDWDDSISGDPVDDISLMACFHPAIAVQALIKGYQSVKPLPDNFVPRFWLHLLRNMVVKAVIRVGAGYFDRESNFFLIASGTDGVSLKNITINRILLAYEGLKGLKNMNDL